MIHVTTDLSNREKKVQLQFPFLETVSLKVRLNLTRDQALFSFRLTNWA